MSECLCGKDVDEHCECAECECAECECAECDVGPPAPGEGDDLPNPEIGMEC